MKPRKPQAPGAPACAICHKPIKRGMPTSKSKTGKTCHAGCLDQAVRAGRAGTGAGSPSVTGVAVPTQGVPKPKSPAKRANNRRTGKSGQELSFEENKRAVLTGETFRSQKPSEWRLGSSPSSAGRGQR